MIMIDLIGHGESEKPASGRPYHWKRVIRHLHQLIAQLGFKRYAMLGYSMGGRMALAYAVAYPGEVEKLVLESASFGECGMIRRLKRRILDKRLARKIRRNGIEWFEQHWSGLGMFATQTELPSAVRDQIRARRLANAPHALANSLIGSGQGTFPCLRKKVSALSMPVLYIFGNRDEKYSQTGLAFVNINPGILAEGIPGAGHNTHIEDPLMFSEVLKKFLNT
jgi:2-succinyl-6-hydroxy-2,4-cyclohexadiene-1-carboxylate synthase